MLLESERNTYFNSLAGNPSIISKCVDNHTPRTPTSVLTHNPNKHSKVGLYRLIFVLLIVTTNMSIRYPIRSLFDIGNLTFSKTVIFFVVFFTIF